MSTRYDAGDVVATPDGRGVVVAALATPTEFPQGEDATTTVEASEDRPAYVVGLAAGGSAAYRANALAATAFDEEPETTDVAEDRPTRVVDRDVDGLDDLPEGWDRRSVLEFWSSVGGSWEAAVDELGPEFGEERAERFASAAKDEVLRTERWRGRF